MSQYHGGTPVNYGGPYCPIYQKTLGQGSFGSTSLYKLIPPITKTNGDIREYVVRKTALKDHGVAVRLLREEIDKLRTISTWRDSRDHNHVCIILSLTAVLSSK